MGKCKNCYEKYEEFSEGRFEKLGVFISNHPRKILAICIAVNLLFLIGFINFSVENDVEILYTPENSQAYKDREFLKKVFSDPTTGNFESYQLSSLGRYADIIIISKNRSNIMNQYCVDEINNIDRFIQNSIIFQDPSLSSIRYPDICAIGTSGCGILGKIVLKTNFQQQFISKNVTYPTFLSEIISPIFANPESKNNVLISTIGVKLRYFLRQNTSLSIGWEKTYLEQIAKLKTNITDIAFATSDSLGTELDKNTNSDIKFFSLTFTLMMTYACLASASSWIKCNNVANRMNLGIAGVMTPVLGIGSALGFVSGIGVKFTNIVGVMPFLIIGIGIDDMFILMSGMAEAPSLLTNTVENRMGYMLKKSGIAITITSLTNLLAFSIGATSVFISIRNFCIYTGMAVLFCYFNQLFFLSPSICLNEQRTSELRHYCICCLKVTQENPAEIDKKQKRVCMSGSIPESRKDVESFLEKYPKKIAIKLLSHIVGKIMICIVFVAYIVSAIYGAIHMKQGLLLYNLVADNSYFYTYSSWDDKFFTVEPVIALCIKTEQKYSITSTQSLISDILDKAKQDPKIDDNFEINWLKAYKLSPFYNITTETGFINGLYNFLNNAASFKNDIMFDSSRTKIISSKFYVKANNIKTTQDQGSLMKRLREISEKTGFSCFFYTPAFIFFEQFVQILPSTLQTVGIAVAVMLVVTFIFMPKPLIIFIVALTLVSIIVGIFGFMYYWDLTLSSITMIHLVMSVGFSVDFTVHVCHAFLTVRHENNLIQRALDLSGGPVFNAALSSLLGIFMLAFSSSYVFTSFGKVMFLVVIFGLLHAAFFLPLLLYVLISVANRKNVVAQTDEKTQQRVESQKENSNDITLDNLQKEL